MKAERVAQGVPPVRIGGVSQWQAVFLNWRFWLGAMVHAVVLGALVLWLEPLGAFPDWMAPVLLVAVALQFMLSLRNFLRLRRADIDQD